MLIRADGAGASHGLLEWLTELNTKRGRTVQYSVGFAVTEKVRDAISTVPKKAWAPAIDPEGEARENGDVVEVTGMLDLSTWPDGMRVIIRREHPHPGAALSLFEEADGWRYQAVATNTPLAAGGQVAFLEARHRAHARVETRIRHAKDTGIGRFPSREYAINQAWLIATSIAADLIAWLRAARPAREAEGLRAESVAVPLPARPGPPGPRRPTTPPAVPGHVALGRGRPDRVHRDPQSHAIAHLRLATSPIHPRASTTRRPAPQRHAPPPRPKPRTRCQLSQPAETDPGELARIGV